MKKFLPLILLGVGIFVFVGVYFFVVRGGKDPEVVEVEEEIALIEVDLPNRPVIELTPRADGHWFDMVISKLGKFEAESLDYELTYTLPDGRIQGTNGMVRLNGQESEEVEILLGSESSGNYYYYEGVEDGKLSLRFRNDKGKLLVKFVTDFKLVNDVEEVVSYDESFKYVLEEENANYFIVMPIIGYPGDETPVPLTESPYGVFSSDEDEVPGTVDWGQGDVYQLQDDEWVMLEDGASEDTGIFIAS